MSQADSKTSIPATCHACRLSEAGPMKQYNAADTHLNDDGDKASLIEFDTVQNRGQAFHLPCLQHRPCGPH